MIHAIIADDVPDVYPLLISLQQRFAGQLQIDISHSRPIMQAHDPSFDIKKNMTYEEIEAYLDSPNVDEDLILFLDQGLTTGQTNIARLREKFSIRTEIPDDVLDGICLAITAARNEAIKRLLVYVVSNRGLTPHTASLLRTEFNAVNVQNPSLHRHYASPPVDGGRRLTYINQGQSELDAAIRAFEHALQIWSEVVQRLVNPVQQLCDQLLCVYFRLETDEPGHPPKLGPEHRSLLWHDWFERAGGLDKCYKPLYCLCARLPGDRAGVMHFSSLRRQDWRGAVVEPISDHGVPSGPATLRCKEISFDFLRHIMKASADVPVDWADDDAPAGTIRMPIAPGMLFLINLVALCIEEHVTGISAGKTRDGKQFLTLEASNTEHLFHSIHTGGGGTGVKRLRELLSCTKDYLLEQARILGYDDDAYDMVETLWPPYPLPARNPANRGETIYRTLFELQLVANARGSAIKLIW